MRCLVLLAVSVIGSEVEGLDLALRSCTADAWPEVLVAVRATDSGGRLIRNLRADDFTAEIGQSAARVVEVAPFRSQTEGMDIVLVLDASGTMRGTPLENAKSAALDLLAGAVADDRITVATFNDDVWLAGQLGDDRVSLSEVIGGIEAAGTKSVLFKAVVRGLRLLQDQGRVGRRAAVVVSDGHDESAEAYTLEDCIREGRDADIPVFTLGLTQDERIYLANLEKLAERTGGTYQEVALTSDLSGLYRDIYEQLRQQHLLTVQAPADLRGGRSHKLDLSLSFRGQHAATSVTFTAPAPASTPEMAAATPAAGAHYPFLWIGLGVAAAALAGGGGALWLRSRRRQGRGEGAAAKSAVPPVGSDASSRRSGAPRTEAAPNPPPTQAPAAVPSKPGRRRGQTIVARQRPEAWAALVGLSGPHKDREFLLWGDEMAIGGRPGNDIVLEDDTVSGRHATVGRISGKAELIDLKSTNGTFVNDVRVTRSVLTDGDHIKIGIHEYLYKLRAA